MNQEHQHVSTVIIPGSKFSVDLAGWRQGPWFQREALRALERGHCQAIGTRDGSGLYLLRLWLSEPKPCVGEDRWDSADSLLLHYFLRGDDDASLHDHPWSFDTELLAGAYVEHLPPPDWQPGSLLGPAWDQHTVVHMRGDSVQHQAADLHCVGQIRRGTWTCVRTGPKVRSWGFHPPGKPWMYWRTYLGLDAPAVAAASA